MKSGDGFILSEYVIEMLGITKSFPGVIANDNITLQLKNGEIHALSGENGAGKSTLMSILFGLQNTEKGEIRKNSEVISIRSPKDAAFHGIGMVHQNFMLVENFTVLENIILGAENTSYGFLDKKAARNKILSLSKKYGLNVNPDAKAESLPVSMQQRIEILKMLYRENEIMIFDEPTSVLTPKETERLLETMKSFCREGKSILFITHRLDEIFAVADRVTVLRKGKVVGTLNVKDTDKATLSRMMVGHPLENKAKKEKQKCSDVILQIEGLCVPSQLHKEKLAVKNVSLTLHSGEILCVAGVEGNGQSELAGSIAGLNKVTGGSIRLLGQDVTRMSIRGRNRFLSHIPEDRKRYGLVTDFPLMYNLVLQRYREKEFQHLGFMKKDKIKSYAEKLIEGFDIRSAEGSGTLTGNMSGGNQQRAVIARELDRNKPLIIAVNPTHGLDVGATEFIHRELIKKRDEGHAVLLFSLELDEVMSLADRILVINSGELVGEFTPESTTVREIGLYMAGGHNDE